ncbi:ABC transporter ATP-binding protein [Clostridium septicum]|uniref:ABC transporter ATP-binding protein n=2 Tax=Clostridium septicum TaxID=1504 RepID=A0ABY5B0P8_CLOSE|nr:ABC transporter ATP-binding protein [Clostridium septicum]MDU1313691.1 ABC transporter ATP-binding protein [Clostridium septicum]UEC21602.1 ABC transporter ATP-binding protein [Clostridium septicum]USS00349.1 ABC transporter ATP-binding protein [Clostridium septicum]WLF68900.1 ABC transporter ATP-binding protein [Clostridium septicum]
MSMIKLTNINKIYGELESETKALNNINLEIKKGELVALTGKSGSGKSTLLNLLGQLDVESSGSISIDGTITKNLTKNQRSKFRNSTIGFIVQHFALINDYTVYDNIELPLKYGNVKKSLRKDLILDVSSKLGIEDKLKSKPNNLSGGQCQRVAIARAIVNNPNIILADEPTGALDTVTGSEVMNIFKSLNSNGKTVIIVTHDLKLANECDRIIELKDGCIISDKIISNKN